MVVAPSASVRVAVAAERDAHEVARRGRALAGGGGPAVGEGAGQGHRHGDVDEQVGHGDLGNRGNLGLGTADVVVDGETGW